MPTPPKPPKREIVLRVPLPTRGGALGAVPRVFHFGASVLLAVMAVHGVNEFEWLAKDLQLILLGGSIGAVIPGLLGALIGKRR